MYFGAFPLGWAGYYGLISRLNPHLKIDYTTLCIHSNCCSLFVCFFRAVKTIIQRLCLNCLLVFHHVLWSKCCFISNLHLTLLECYGLRLLKALKGNKQCVMCRTGVLSFMSESNNCSQRDEGARDPYETEKSSFGMKIQLYENRVESLNF